MLKIAAGDMGDSLENVEKLAPISSSLTYFAGSNHFLSRSMGLDHTEGASPGFMVASGGVLSEGYGHGGPGVCLGDGQTKAEGVPSQGGRGDALLRRMPLIPDLRAQPGHGSNGPWPRAPRFRGPAV